MVGDVAIKSVPRPTKLPSKTLVIHSTCLSKGQTEVFNQLMKSCESK